VRKKGYVIGGCGLALHPRAIPAGRCTRIRFAQLAVDVHCTDLKASFDLYVVRSSIKYLHAWLLDAAAKKRGNSCIDLCRGLAYALGSNSNTRIFGAETRSRSKNRVASDS
jgi:hypothetical protein